jgi:MarR family 2-MHQ and catechol resistance regulon transcriptional repressor
MMESLGGYKSDLSPDEKIMMAVVRAAEQFKKKTSALLGNYGLTFAQYNVLRVLDASENGQSTVTGVSRIMLVSGANTTGIVKRLEKSGLLIRKNHPSDERVTVVEISPRGRRILENVKTEKDDRLSHYVKGLTEKEKQEILNILRRIIKNLGDPAIERMSL